MAFSAITSAQISAGEATKQELFTKTKDNFDDHESRLITVEGATGAFDAIDFTVNGRYGNLTTFTGLLYYRLTFNMTITAARLFIIEAGSAGTTEVNVLFKRGAGAFTSIFTTRPSVAFGAGDLALSTNAVIDAAEEDLEAGDLLRLDLTAVQTDPVDLILFLERDKT